jgi:hypothetical protein
MQYQYPVEEFHLATKAVFDNNNNPAFNLQLPDVLGLNNNLGFCASLFQEGEPCPLQSMYYTSSASILPSSLQWIPYI